MGVTWEEMMYAEADAETLFLEHQEKDNTVVIEREKVTGIERFKQQNYLCECYCLVCDCDNFCSHCGKKLIFKDLN